MNRLAYPARASAVAVRNEAHDRTERDRHARAG
jgi:hypothetical protein